MHILKTNYLEIKIVFERQVFNWIKSRNWVLKSRDCLKPYYIKIKNGVSLKWIVCIFYRFECVQKVLMKEKEFGHLEINLVIIKKTSGYVNLITLNERKTRMGFIIRLDNKNPMKLNSTRHQFIKANKLNIKTLTCDNGIEFEQLRLVTNKIISMFTSANIILYIKEEATKISTAWLDTFIKKELTSLL